MGTNYYVHVPNPQQKCPHPCQHCSQNYEPVIKLHIGKSSAGWRFLHQAYRNKHDSPQVLHFPVTDRESWLRMLTLGPIFDEYGVQHTEQELLDWIEVKQQDIAHDSPRAEALSGLDLGGWNDRWRDEHQFVSGGYDFCDSEFS